MSKYFAQPQGDGLGLNVLSWEVKYWFLLSVGNKNPFIVLNRELCNIQGYSNLRFINGETGDSLTKPETSLKVQYEIFLS